MEETTNSKLTSRIQKVEVSKKLYNLLEIEKN